VSEEEIEEEVLLPFVCRACNNIVYEQRGTEVNIAKDNAVGKLCDRCKAIAEVQDIKLDTGKMVVLEEVIVKC